MGGGGGGGKMHINCIRGMKCICTHSSHVYHMVHIATCIRTVSIQDRKCSLAAAADMLAPMYLYHWYIYVYACAIACVCVAVLFHYIYTVQATYVVAI